MVSDRELDSSLRYGGEVLANREAGVSRFRLRLSTISGFLHSSFLQAWMCFSYVTGAQT
jgi:hypothetical protein